MSATIHTLRRPTDLKSVANAMLSTVESLDTADPETAFQEGLKLLRRGNPDICLPLLETVLFAYGRLCLKLGHQPGEAA